MTQPEHASDDTVDNTADAPATDAATPDGASGDSAADAPVADGSGPGGESPAGDSTSREPRAHDFGVAGSWLNGGRSASFQQSLHEMVRMSDEVLEHWTSKVSVDADELATITISSVAAEPIHYVEVALDESGQSAFLLFDTQMALSIVTLMLGGNGDPGEPRPLTPLEAGLLADLALAMCEQFARELHLGPVRFKAHHADQSTMRDGVAEILMSFGLTLTGTKASGRCQLAISPLSLQAHMEIIDRRINGRRRSENATGSAAAAALQPVVVPVVVGFAGIRVPAMDMANLRPGDVIRTGQSLGRQLVASVGNVPVFTVKAGQRGERLVAEVLSLPKHDFPALGSAATSAPTNAHTGAHS